MRRLAVPAALFLVLSLMTGLRAPARAQDATPMSGGLSGYPKLGITVTNDAYVPATETVPAGWVILEITNKSDGEIGAGIIGPPSGMTRDELLQLASTPTAGDEAPSFLYQAVLPGGVNGVQPGETRQAIVFLPANDWAAFGDGDTQQPGFFSSVDGPDSVTTEPTGTASFTLGDFYFGGLDKGFPAGQRLVKITNEGKQPHMAVLGKGPNDMTLEMVNQALARSEDATPAPGELSEDQLTFVPGVVMISSGQTMYMPMNLDAGTYLAICFFSDPATGQAHFMEGMITIFAVK